MNKLIVLLLCLMIVGSLAVTASADVLWLPSDNSFDHEKSTTVNAAYVVPDGMTVNLYKSPESSAPMATWEAGTRVYVGYSQEMNGQLWGVGYAYGNYENEGWFRLDRLQKEYSHTEFMADFGKQCVNSDGTVVTQDEVEEYVYTWTYPGSGVGAGDLPKGILGGDYNDGVVSFQYIYTAPDNSRWGYVGYYMGRCGWVWLDDPDNPETPLLVQEPENTVTDTSPTEKTPESDGTVNVIVALVAAVVVVTGVLIVVKKKKS